MGEFIQIFHYRTIPHPLPFIIQVDLTIVHYIILRDITRESINQGILSAFENKMTCWKRMDMLCFKNNVPIETLSGLSTGTPQMEEKSPSSLLPLLASYSRD
jgi:hypothetical protein